MSSKRTNRNNQSRPRKRSESPQPNTPGFLQWIPLIVVLCILAFAWSGCHQRSNQPVDETYRNTNSDGIKNQSEAPNSSRANTGKSEQSSRQESKDQQPSDDTSDDNGKVQAPSSLDNNADSSQTADANTQPEHRERQPDGEVSSVPGAKGMIALTFDAGASAEPVPAILKALADTGSHATFFFTGKWVKTNPGIAQDIVNAGHEVGNHSWSHPDFTTLSDDEMLDQISRTEQIMQTKLHINGASLFRPPYGARNSEVRRLVADHGYRVIYWAVDCLDSVKKNITAEQIETRVLAKAKQGDIVLMHCGSQATADALPSLIEALNHKGWKVVTVGELLRHE